MQWQGTRDGNCHNFARNMNVVLQLGRQCQIHMELLLLLLTGGVYPGEMSMNAASDFQRGHAIHHIGPCHWIFLCKTPVNVVSNCCLLQP